jgi:hypothetical protein
MIKFKSKELNLLVDAGKFVDEQSRDFIKAALGLKKVKVVNKRHNILSGGPGVGKTYGAVDEANKGKVKYIMLEPGSTDIQIAIKLACAVYGLKKDEELVVIIDDADELVFGDYKALNKWKIALADTDYEQGIIPTFNHMVSMTGTLNSLEKQATTDPSKRNMIKAIKQFIPNDSLGLSIPMDKVRFIILCNLDFEDTKVFSKSPKLKSAIDPVRDRMKYKRININWEKQWGWAAYVLGETQPFDKYKLSMEQKVELMQWMYSNWDKLRSTSYRTVKELAAAMINEPETYMDEWQNELKGH